MTGFDDILQAPVRLDCEVRGRTRVVHLAGDLTRREALRLHDLLFELRDVDGPVVLDLAGVEFLSASGIGLLVELHRHLGEADRSMTLVNVNPAVGDLLRLTRVDTILAVRKTVADALAAEVAV